MTSINKKTLIFNHRNLNKAAEALRAGELIAFPTDTVYGLGTIANNESAIQKLYKVKGRPRNKPLIVLVDSIDSVKKYATEVSETANILMEKFWPGPLTILFPVKEGLFAPSIFAGASEVGMRMPNQLETLLLISMVEFPVVGPSANISGKLSPTTMTHVLNDLEGKIYGIVDQDHSNTQVGIESTVISIDGDVINILRPGVITREMLEQVVNNPVKEISTEALSDQEDPVNIEAQYISNANVLIVPAKSPIQFWKDQIVKYHQVGILAQNDLIENLAMYNQIHATFSIGDKEDLFQINRQLFPGLRYLTEVGCQTILVQSFEDQEETHAYMHRLERYGKWINSKS